MQSRYELLDNTKRTGLTEDWRLGGATINPRASMGRDQPRASLDAVYIMWQVVRNRRISWYLKAKRPKQRLQGGIRGSAIGLAAIRGDNPDVSRIRGTEGSILFGRYRSGIAAALIMLDRFSGSTAWVVIPPVQQIYAKSWMSSSRPGDRKGCLEEC